MTPATSIEPMLVSTRTETMGTGCGAQVEWQTDPSYILGECFVR
jgi:hypothetical protein